MGRKSRRKKQRKVLEDHFVPSEQAKQTSQAGFARFLVEVVRWGAYIALCAPLVVHPSFFFPFVVPKTVFFWIFAEIIFAAWLLLALSNKKFRPRWNAVSIAMGIFVLITVVTSFTGINVERSFWSTFERMAGAIHWLHLALFFFALVFTFRTLEDWKKLMRVSVLVSVLVAVVFLLERIGVTIIPFETRMGSTIGNSSFMAAYLLFNIFFGIWLFTQAKDTWFKAVYGGGLALLVLTVLNANAHGALVAMVGGFFVVCVAWLLFAQKIKFARAIGLIFLASGVTAGAIVTWATFSQYEPVIRRLPYFFSDEGTIGARKVVWFKGWQGFKERPILGWGPENFNVVFTKYYNPCMPLPRCGGEIWFDRTHNIILDNLIHSGIAGLLAYLAIFVGALFMLWKRFWKTKDDWLLPAVVTAILASYFAQNLLVFDMLNTYLMFAFTLAFVAGSLRIPKGHAEPDVSKAAEGSDEKNEEQRERTVLRNPNPASIVFVSIFLAYFLFSFGIQSLQDAHWGIRINGANLTPEERLTTYKKSLSVSPIGNRQTVEFFTNRVIGWLNGGTKIPPDFVAEVGEIMEKTVEKNPLDFRHYMLLGNFYNAARSYNSEYIAKAEKTLETAIELSPTNQQGYTALAQTYFYLGADEKSLEMLEKAVALEPEHINVRLNLADAYVITAKYEDAKREFETLLHEGYTPGEEYYSRIAETYEALGEFDRAIEWHRKIVEASPNDAEAHFKLAKLYQNAGKPQDAKEEGEKARELDPQMQEKVDEFLKEFE